MIVYHLEREREREREREGETKKLSLGGQFTAHKEMASFKQYTS